LERAIAAIEWLFAVIATLLMLSIMVTVFADVTLRYLFNRPLAWAYDLISLYLMAGVYFLVLSGTFAAHAHVGVDILVQQLPAPLRRVCDLLSCLIGIGLFGLIAWVGAQRAWVNWVSDERISGVIAWPTWVAAALVPLGCGLLMLRLSYRSAGLLLQFATGREYVAPLPISGYTAE